MAKIAVLGASGFVGKSVCAELGRAGHKVGRFSPSIIGFDLLDLNRAKTELYWFAPDYIVNCAGITGSIAFVGEYPFRVLAENARMITNLYNIAREVGSTIINPVANCGYPGDASVLKEDEFLSGRLHPSVYGYGFTRRMLLVASQTAHQQYGVDSINLIAPNMYGPGDSTSPNKTHAMNALVIKFLLAVRDGAPEVEIWGTGLPVREWLYVGDFARVVVQAIDKDGPLNRPVNVAQKHGNSIKEIAEMAKRSTGYSGEIVYNDSMPDGAMCKIMDNKLFKQEFPGFEFMPLYDGLDATIEYYRGVL